MNATNRVLMVILAAALLLGAYLIVTDVEETEAAADYSIKDVGLYKGSQYDILIVEFGSPVEKQQEFTISCVDDEGKTKQVFKASFAGNNQSEQMFMSKDIKLSDILSEDVVYTLSTKMPSGTETYEFSLPEAYLVQVVYTVDEVRYDSEFVSYGGYAIGTEDPEVPGETFVGWFTADGEAFDFDEPVYANIALKAVFGEGAEYAIEIDDSIIGGTVTVPAASYAGVPVTIVAEPDEGYELVSYYAYDAKMVPVEVTEAGIFVMPASDVTVGAVFEETPVVEEFTVAFYDGENLIGEDKVEYGETVTSMPEAPVKEGLEFKGWFTAEGIEFDPETPITENLDLFAEYEVITFTVAFYDGEDLIGEVDVEYGKTVTSAPEAPVKEGYTFKAWVTLDGEEFDLATEIYEDLDLYAEYEVMKFTVAFYDGEDLIGEVDVEYGKTVTTIPDEPAKEGQKFIGWFTADGIEFDPETPITEDLDLYADYEPVSYAIAIDEKVVGGTIQVPEDAFFGMPVCIVAEADEGYVLKSYYVFAGESPVEVSETGIFVMPASDVTVGAVFEEIPAGEYSVKVYYGAMLIVSETAAEGKEMSIDVSRYIEAAEVEVAGPEGLEFQFDDGILTFVMPGYDVEFAIADVMYDVTFYVGEEEYDSQAVVSGECAYAPEDPEVEGAVFMGWYLTGADEPFDFDTPITQDLDLYALMVPFVQTFDVEFYVNGGVYRTITVNYGEKVEEIEAPEIPGQTFKGWYEGLQPFDFDTPITEDHQLYAKYEDAPVGDEHTVTFYVGDEVFDKQTVKDGEFAQELYPPFYPGQQFEGWYELGSEVPFDFKTPITQDYELYAFYEDVGFTVTFYVDGAEYDKQTVEAGGYAVEPADPVKAGAVFMGWFEPGAIAPFDFETPITQDVALNALFEPFVEEFTVTFYVGEEIYDVQTVAVGDVADEPEDPVLAGATFIGWFLEGAGEPFDFATPITQDLDLHAVFKPFVPVEKYKVTVLPAVNGTVTVEPTEAEEGDIVTVTATPDDGYKTAAVYVDGKPIEMSAAGDYSFSMPAKDVEVSAVFAEIPVGGSTVTYVDENGVIETVSYEVGQEVVYHVSVPQGKRLAYVDFEPWMEFLIEQEKGIIEFVAVEGNYTAMISYDSLYTITVLDQDGKELGLYECFEEDDVVIEFSQLGIELVSATAEPMPEDFDVDTESRMITFTMPASDVTVTVTLKPVVVETHDVTFYVGEEVYDSQEVAYGGLAAEPEDPVLAGAVFIGWFTVEGELFDFKTPITEDIDLIAEFEPFVETFEVTFYVGEEVYDSQEVAYGECAVKPADPELVGATFIGWFLAGAGEPFDFATPITQDLDLYAVFEPFVETFEVTFYVDDEVYDYQTVAVGDVADEPEDPVIAGAAFLGWFLEGAIVPFDFETPITQDLDLHALFEPVVEEFTVTFYVNGEEYDVQTVAYNGLAVEPDAPSVEGSEFLGWFLVGTIVPFDFETPITQDLDLYAEFVTYSETVTVSLNQIGSVIYITVTAEDDDAVVKSGEMEIQYTYLVSKMSFGKERLIVMTSPVIKVDIEGGETIAAVEYDLGSEEYLSTISTVWATYTADGIDSEKSAPIIFESVDNAAFLAAKE